jgi:protein gp37
MADKSKISWTNATWNPVRGCERVSEGCRNCYAEVLAARHSYEGGWGSEVAHYVGGRPRWTGVIETKAQQVKLPLKWREPRMIFVNSMSDLFHDRVPFNFVDELYEVMEKCPRHTFQILTKRPGRMLHYLTLRQKKGQKPLPNAWHGVSAEDQATFDERVGILRTVPTAVRWVSAEPMLDYIDGHGLEGLHWVVVGLESGSGRRERDIDIARSMIGQCLYAQVPVFVKQDNGPRPGMKGRFSDEEWALKNYPRHD